LKLINVESAKVTTNYFTVESSFKDFVLSAPKTCIRRLLKLDKIPIETKTIQEEKAPETHVSIINYIQKEQHKSEHVLFITCVNCSGTGRVYKKMGTVMSGPFSCPVCKGFKYSGPETDYKLVAGKIERF
jgi:predicted Zn-ribbon and HTH transcriptional regulator